MVDLAPKNWGITMALKVQKVGNYDGPEFQKPGNYRGPGLGNYDDPEAL